MYCTKNGIIDISSIWLNPDKIYQVNQPLDRPYVKVEALNENKEYLVICSAGKNIVNDSVTVLYHADKGVNRDGRLKLVKIAYAIDNTYEIELNWNQSDNCYAFIYRNYLGSCMVIEI